MANSRIDSHAIIKGYLVMRVSVKQVVVLIIITVIVMLALALFGWALFHMSSYAEGGKEKVLETKMRSYADLSNTYHTRLGFYTGLCEATGLDKTFTCTADEQSFRISVPVRTGYFCIDEATSLRYYDQLGAGRSCR